MTPPHRSHWRTEQLYQDLDLVGMIPWQIPSTKEDDIVGFCVAFQMPTNQPI